MLNALFKAVEKAKECYHSDHSEWQDVIDAIVELVPKRDMAKFDEFCNFEEYGLEEHNNDGVTDLRMVLGNNEEDEDCIDDDSNGWGGGCYEDLSLIHI